MFETFNKKTVTIVALVLAFAFVYSYVSDDASSGTGYPIIKNTVVLSASNLGNNTNHTECRGLSCVVVNGAGQNECRNNRDCIRVGGGGNVSDKVNKTTKTHTECFVYPNGVGYCASVNGTGRNQCGISTGYTDCNKLDCITGGSNSTNGTCKMVAGIGGDICSPINSTC